VSYAQNVISGHITKVYKTKQAHKAVCLFLCLYIVFEKISNIL